MNTEGGLNNQPRVGRASRPSHVPFYPRASIFIANSAISERDISPRQLFTYLVRVITVQEPCKQLRWVSYWRAVDTWTQQIINSFFLRNIPSLSLLGILTTLENFKTILRLPISSKKNYISSCRWNQYVSNCYEILRKSGLYRIACVSSVTEGIWNLRTSLPVQTLVEHP